MNTIAVCGRSFDVNENGFLAHPDQWSIAVAEYFAKAEGIEMTSQRWEVVNYLREYYRRYQIAPMVKVLTREIGRRFGVEKGNCKYLYELFPGGPAMQACKIAGLPGPAGCI
jgi:tRNA 2-thiouridine synthesizing protein E